MLDSIKKRIAGFMISCVDAANERHDEVCNDAQCDCDDNFSGLTPEEKIKMIENWVPPSRFCIISGGKDFWVDNYKFNPVMGIDIFWTQKIGGEDKHVIGTIFDTNVTIFDYESSMTPEVFDHVKQQAFDYVMQKAQEAKLQEDAVKNKSPPSDVNFAAYG